MSCREFEENILSYRDGQLDAGKSEAMEAHMNACSSCSLLYREVSSTYGAFDEFVDAGIPDAASFVDEVMEQVEVKQSQSVFQLFRKAAAVAASVILIAGLAAALIAGTSIVRSGSTVATSENEYISSLASDFHLNTEEEVTFESYLITQNSNE
ncbi:MAG TPA: zf-HC2 domain-containing protein [Bacteroidales bacterium]|nr:zf-HC2 domain-containing protein [Bacteroidales bacterium]